MHRLGGIIHHAAWLFLVTACLRVDVAAAQQQGYSVVEQPVFQHFGVREGLPSNSIQSLLQDQEGYLWVGTNQGLSRFDGLNFHNLRLDLEHYPHYGSNLFQTLFIDSRGRRWAAPENGGLLEFSAVPEIIRHFGPPRLPDDSLWALAEDCEGRLLLGYFQSGLLRFDPDGQQPPEPVPEMPAVPITSVITDQCEVWVGTYRNGVYRIDQQGAVHHYRQAPDSHEPLTVLKLKMTRAGLLVGARNNLLMIDRNQQIRSLKSQAGFPPGQVSVTGIEWQSDHRLLLSSHAGLLAMNLDHAAEPGVEVSFERVSDSHDVGRIRGSSNFNHLLQDRDGAIWVGTLSQGLLRYEPDFWDARVLRFQLPLASKRYEDRIRAAAAVHGDQGLVLASIDRGISFLDVENMQLLSWPEPYSQQRFHSLLSVSDSELWLGSASGLFRVRHRNGLPLGPPEAIKIGDRAPGYIADIVAAGSDRVWVVDQGTGLLLLNVSGEVISAITSESGLPTQYYNGVEVDANGDAWAFGGRGVVRLILDRNGQVLIEHPHGLPERSVNDLELAEDELWLAHEEGVQRYRREAKEWISTGIWPLEYGAARLIPQALELDELGKVWVGSLAGLGVLKPETDRIRMLDQPLDTIGLHIRRSSLLRLANSTLLVGSQNGLLKLSPRRVPEPRSVSPRLSVLETADQVFRFPWIRNGVRDGFRDLGLVFSVDEQAVLIRASPMGQPGLAQQSPRLQIRGYDAIWRPLSADWELLLPELVPGRYQLRLGDSEESVQQTTTIRVKAAGLATPPVRGFAILGFALVAFWFGRGIRLAHRRRRLLRQSRQAEESARAQSRTTSAITASLSSTQIAQALVEKCQSLPGVSGACLRAWPGVTELVPETASLSDPAMLDELSVAISEWLSRWPSEPGAELRRVQFAGWVLCAWPLIVGGRSRGCLILIAQGQLSNEVLLRVNSMLRVAETAFDNARLYRRSVAFAEEADQAVTFNRRWVAMVSHELRGPLHGLMGTIAQLADQVGQERSTDNIKVLDEASRQMLGLIDDVLVQESGPQRQFSIQPGHFDLRTLTEQLVQRFAGVAAQKGLELYRVHAAALGNEALADRMRLDQVLSNLLNNALKFTDSGYVRLSIKPGVLPGVVHFSVSDTGPGIPASDLRVIQEPYQRGSGDSSVAGVGLGLSIVRDLLHAMGTRLHVSSDPGQGSVFEFSLPGVASTRDAHSTVPALLACEPLAVLAQQPLAPVVNELLDHFQCQWRRIHEWSERRQDEVLIVDASLLQALHPRPRWPNMDMLVLGTATERLPETCRSVPHPVTESALAQALLELVFARILDQES